MTTNYLQCHVEGCCREVIDGIWSHEAPDYPYDCGLLCPEHLAERKESLDSEGVTYTILPWQTEMSPEQIAGLLENTHKTS